MNSKHVGPSLKILQKLLWRTNNSYTSILASNTSPATISNLSHDISSHNTTSIKESKVLQPLDLQRNLIDSVSWYNCGPTVYSDSHMGHARNYVTIDILRRILEDYFKVRCNFVQNITNIDDKLINAVENWRVTRNPSFAPHSAIHASSPDSEILKEIAQHFEEAFWKDMKDLNVRQPDYVLRVTEHMEEIQEMIIELLKKKCAYIGSETGSIYFDTQAFIDSGRKYDQFHCCTPSSSEAAGWSSAETIGLHEKKSPRDFVLWKQDASGFGFLFPGHVKGRPGWHIECSAMSSTIFGGHIDIHSGGIDLQFPHHTNENAQSCAYYNQKTWVDDWIHIGHLHIHGLKMSKSLKNFTTIQEGLKKYDSRIIRMMALQHHFSDSIDYSDDLMLQSVNMEKFFREFFLKMDGLLRNSTKIQTKPTKESLALRRELIRTESFVHEALIQDFNTPKALAALADLVRQTNRYEQQIGKSSSLDYTLLGSIARYITDMFVVFGFTDDSLGYSKKFTASSTGIIDCFTKFRNDIRSLARSNKVHEILDLCDKVRDEILPDMGIRLEDLPDGSGIWKYEDPKDIKMHQKREQQEKELRLKHAEEKQARQTSRMEYANIPPQEYFKTLFSSEYSKYDEEGFPILDSQGNPLSKSQTKRLKKLLQKHITLYNKTNQL